MQQPQTNRTTIMVNHVFRWISKMDPL